MGELTKTDNGGKNSPGPVYQYDDNVKYDAVSILLFWGNQYFHRHLDGQWVQKLELARTNLDMTSMKMLCFWMIQLKQTFQESQDVWLQKLELNHDLIAII